MIDLTPIERLNLSPRPYNALVIHKIDFVEHLSLFAQEELRRLRRIGKVAAAEIAHAMSQRGFGLSTNPSKPNALQHHRQTFQNWYAKDYPQLFKK